MDTGRPARDETTDYYDKYIRGVLRSPFFVLRGEEFVCERSSERAA